MIKVVETGSYSKWFDAVRDQNAKGRILIRIRRMTLGNFGDVSPVGEGVSELRVHYGPGYRVYFVRRGEKLIILLGGGDKSSQTRDIAAAKTLAKTF
ncbi:type II toxin-antitoxin system RelE/ParE family toxin [Aliihoeflea sp. 2WW]|uniref:type II toxin-antitoxin system RelE/ParE family toxin n=1 Tax=Aliihoeflea sp. 2WW TaxID=1381123 RepID=UPI000464E730|nr:type II toxin-antitoxin system RelE/ParE family toxin [Aliihoeflea sp. 2WW]